VLRLSSPVNACNLYVRRPQGEGSPLREFRWFDLVLVYVSCACSSPIGIRCRLGEEPLCRRSV
jgi:hypothetical protein